MPILQRKEVIRLREVAWWVHSHSVRLEQSQALRLRPQQRGPRLEQSGEQNSQKAGSFDSSLLLRGQQSVDTSTPISRADS